MQDYYKEAERAFDATNYVEAIKYCDKVLEQEDDGSHATANLVKGNSFYALKRFREAIVSWSLIPFEGAVDKRVFAEMLLKKAFAHHELQQFEERQQCFRDALAVDPSLVNEVAKLISYPSSEPENSQKRERASGNLGVFSSVDTESDDSPQSRRKLTRFDQEDASEQAAISPSTFRKA